MVTSQLYSPARVIMIGRNANRVELAKTMGATHGIVSGQGVDVVAAVKELTNGEGADTVIEAVGVPATFELCQELVAPGGTIRTWAYTAARWIYIWKICGIKHQ